MSRMDLVASVAASGDMSAADARRLVDLVFSEIERGVARSDGKYAIAGFGAFTVSARAARKGRNPRTGEEIDIPAAKVLKFKPAAPLRAAAGCL